MGLEKIMPYDMNDEAARETRKRRLKEWKDLDFAKGKYKRGNKK